MWRARLYSEVELFIIIINMYLNFLVRCVVSCTFDEREPLEDILHRLS